MNKLKEKHTRILSLTYFLKGNKDSKISNNKLFDKILTNVIFSFISSIKSY